MGSTGSKWWQLDFKDVGAHFAITDVRYAGAAGYVATGAYNAAKGARGSLVVGIDISGQEIWRTALPNVDQSKRRHLQDLALVPGGGVVAVGFDEDTGANGAQAWMVRLGATGGLQWQRHWGGAGADALWAVEALSDGFVAAGYTDGKNNHLVRTNPLGYQSCEKAGKCAGITHIGCPAGDACASGLCDPAKGCTTAPKADMTLCSDGNTCTAKKWCISGSCVDKKVGCDDNDPCTADTCENGEKCVNKPLDEGAKCGEKLACIAGKCVSGCTQHSECEAGQECKVGVCVKACKLDVLEPINLVKSFVPRAAFSGQLVATYSAKHKERWIMDRSDKEVARYDHNWQDTGKSFPIGTLVSAVLGAAAADNGDFIVATGGPSNAPAEVVRFKEFSATKLWTWKTATNGSSLFGVAHAAGKVYAVQFTKPFSQQAIYTLDATDGSLLATKSVAMGLGNFVMVGDRAYGLYYAGGWAYNLQTPSFGNLGQTTIAPLKLDTLMFDGDEVCGIGSTAKGRVWCASVYGKCGVKDYKPLFNQSDWLTTADMKKLNSWAGSQDAHWKRCYSKKVDKSLKELGVTCANKKPTLIVAMQGGGKYVMGGYTEVPYIQATKYESVTDDAAYLYTLVGDGKATAVPGGIARQHSPTYPVFFGSSAFRCSSDHSCSVASTSKNYVCPSAWGASCGKYFWPSSSTTADIFEVFYRD